MTTDPNNDWHDPLGESGITRLERKLETGVHDDIPAREEVTAEQAKPYLPTGWVDPSMYPSEEVPVGVQVTLLNMTSDPLGSIAAMAAIYEGRVVRDLDDLSDYDREQAWSNTQKSNLGRTPLEAVSLHFLIEGVDRAFTHQLVRQRTAAYAQESMRFAVKGREALEATLPPSIREGTAAAAIWQRTTEQIMRGYRMLVDDQGIPAEDARGLLPTAVPTRIHYVTNLRGLLEHAGNRLCTQAQFVWREVFSQIAKAIVEHLAERGEEDQGRLISEAFKPVCYQLGHCPMKASFDRPCKIRERVDAFAHAGVPSSMWSEGADNPYSPEPLLPIATEEWLLDPEAAR